MLLAGSRAADAARRDSKPLPRRRMEFFFSFVRLLLALIFSSLSLSPVPSLPSPFSSFLLAMAGRNAVVSFLKETYGKQTVLECIKAGGFKAFFDGSLA